MKRGITSWGFVILAVTGLITGYVFLAHYQHNYLHKPPDMAVKYQTEKAVVNGQTRIIYEKEYMKCRHVIVTGFNNKKEIMGMDSQGLKKYFKINEGYELSFGQNTLIIHQNINDYCPEDQQQFKLKEHQGYVAVYTGAEENEILLRVTAIPVKLLPDSIQKDIRNGKYCFQDEAALNDTLENFDEYI